MELALRIVKQTCHLHLFFVEPRQDSPRAQLYSFTKGVEAKQEDHGETLENQNLKILLVLLQRPWLCKSPDVVIRINQF